MVKEPRPVAGHLQLVRRRTGNFGCLPGDLLKEHKLPPPLPLLWQNITSCLAVTSELASFFFTASYRCTVLMISDDDLLLMLPWLLP